MGALERCWLPLALSRSVGAKPQRREALDRCLVVFRDSRGRPVALEDRCPHRGVALSGGAVRGDAIQCPYHGWTFDSSGACTSVPSLCAGQKLPEHRIPAFSLVEQDGLIWVCLAADPYEPAPPRWRLPESKGFVSSLAVESDYLRLMENLVDNPHSGYIHAGLIRREPTTEVRAEITRDEQGVSIQTFGEYAGNSLLYKIFGRRGEQVEHQELCRFPSTMLSVYRQGGRVAAMESVICPIGADRCQWYFRISLGFGGLTNVLFPFFRRTVHRIVVQDRDVVADTHAQDLRHPDRKWVSTQADTPALLVAKAAAGFAQNGPSEPFSATTTICYKI